MKKHMGMAALLLAAVLLGGCGGTGSATEGNAQGTPAELAAGQESGAEPRQGQGTSSGTAAGQESGAEIGQGQGTSSGTAAGQESGQGTLAGTGEGADAAGQLADGTYLAEFKTDSGMFHVSEACDGKGTLTVKDGNMEIHISLASKNIVNLYPGRAEDAKKEGAKLLAPTEDSVTYSDGITEEVYGFDVPVPALGEEFDLALIGKKGKWYDHKASVSNPVPAEGGGEGADAQKGGAQGEGADAQKDGAQREGADAQKDGAQGEGANAQKDGAQGEGADAQKDSSKRKGIGAQTGGTQGENADALEDGTYQIEVTLTGGSGRAEVLSPATLTVADGKATATIKWSSPDYDYMVVGGEKYLPTTTEGGSVFEFPIPGFDEPIGAIGDTVAMSRPHEVEYTLTFHSGTIKKE